jgi:hypothetical protein
MESRVRNSHRTTILTILTYHLLWRHVGLFLALLILPLFATAHTAHAAQVGDKDFVLDCVFDKYSNNTNYSPKFAKSWIPLRQEHRIARDTIVFDSYYKKLKGTITKRNDERIEWTYLERAKDRKGKNYSAKRIYSYFFTTNKIATRLEFGTGYINIEYVWGTCDEKGKGQKLSKNSEKTSKASDRNKAGKNKRFFPIDIDDWRTIRVSSSSVLKYHKRHDAILFTSTNPWFGAVHGRLTSLPKADLRYAIYWVTDNVFELKGYNHFNYGKPDKIVALKHNGKPYIMIVDQDLDRIHDKRKTFMQISMRFDKSGGWFLNDTVLK